MKSSLAILAAATFALTCSAQTSTTEFRNLVGRKAVAQRMPFFQPGTYQPLSKAYAGQTATITEVKPSAIMANANIAAFTITIQFGDGTKADTGPMPVMA